MTAMHCAPLLDKALSVGLDQVHQSTFVHYSELFDYNCIDINFVV